MTRLVLTVEQARDLQSLGTQLWPGPWAFLLAIQYPEEPDSRPDLDRLNGGATMMALGCGEEQIALQMSWKQPSAPVRTLARQRKRETKRA